MLGTRRIRVAAALFVGTAVVMLLWPRATGYVSKFAVINAPILTVRAPMDGTITRATPGPASAIRRDEVLFDMRASRASRAEITRLEGEVLSASRHARALRDEEEHVAHIAETLHLRARTEMDSELDFLTQKLEELIAIRRLHEVQWDQAFYEQKRLADLAKRGTVPKAQGQDATFQLREAEAQLLADDARIAAMKVEIAAIESGLPSPAGTGRRDEGYDRIDDIEMALSDIRSRRKAAEGKRDAAEAQLEALREEFDGLGQFSPLASTDGVIWTASRREGASVTTGSDLFQVLDCERRFLEVVFDERAFEDLQAGSEAIVYLRGSDDPFNATVVSRHAAGGGAAIPAIDAAVGAAENTNGVKVFLRLDPADIGDPNVAQAFCDVGRTAEVRIRDPRVTRLFDNIFARLTATAREGPTILAEWVRSSGNG